MARIRELAIRLQNRLVATTNWSEANSLIESSEGELHRLSKTVGCEAAAAKGLERVSYLKSYWMTFALWQSWSEYGRVVAAAKTGLTVQGILPTKNHLESFNGVLERKHLGRWLRGGRTA